MAELAEVEREEETKRDASCGRGPAPASTHKAGLHPYQLKVCLIRPSNTRKATGLKDYCGFYISHTRDMDHYG